MKVRSKSIGVPQSLTLPNIATTGTPLQRPKTKLLLWPRTTNRDRVFTFRDFRRHHTCADLESWYLCIWHGGGIGKGRGEGAQAGSTYDADLGLPEVLRDALGEEFETGGEGQLSVGHGYRSLEPREDRIGHAACW